MPIPQDPGPDSTLALLREGYAFIPNRCRRYGSDLFGARLMLSAAVCISGADAAKEFYRPDQISRRGGMPQTTFTLIQDNGSVMALDGEAHHRRKAMYLSLMSQPALRRLVDSTAAHLRRRARRWPEMGQVTLLPGMEAALCGAICEWAGLTLPEPEVERLARDFAAMVDGTGAFGPRNWRGHLHRVRTERWTRALIRRIRAGEVAAPDGSAARVIAEHCDGGGAPLDLAVAAVELINVLRATVANGRYMVFAALALHANVDLHARLLAGGETDLEAFVQEVRRFYPFIPFIGGRVLRPFIWRGHGFAAGDWVLMDLYGTNHDPRIWPEPDIFRPNRFHDWNGDPYAFVPSGAGEHGTGHRCPGEWITIEQMKTVIGILVRELRYVVPPQDLSIDLGRMPALPASRFVVSDVRMHGNA